jgi:hypothetical protein
MDEDASPTGCPSSSSTAWMTKIPAGIALAGISAAMDSVGP